MSIVSLPKNYAQDGEVNGQDMKERSASYMLILATGSYKAMGRRFQVQLASQGQPLCSPRASDNGNMDPEPIFQ